MSSPHFLTAFNTVKTALQLLYQKGTLPVFSAWFWAFSSLLLTRPLLVLPNRDDLSLPLTRSPPAKHTGNELALQVTGGFTASITSHTQRSLHLLCLSIFFTRSLIYPYAPIELWSILPHSKIWHPLDAAIGLHDIRHNRYMYTLYIHAETQTVNWWIRRWPLTR